MIARGEAIPDPSLNALGGLYVRPVGGMDPTLSGLLVDAILSLEVFTRSSFPPAVAEAVEEVAAVAAVIDDARDREFTLTLFDINNCLLASESLHSSSVGECSCFGELSLLDD